MIIELCITRFKNDKKIFFKPGNEQMDNLK